MQEFIVAVAKVSITCETVAFPVTPTVRAQSPQGPFHDQSSSIPSNPDSESVSAVPLLRSTIVLATPHVGSHTAVLAPCPVTHCAV